MTRFHQFVGDFSNDWSALGTPLEATNSTAIDVASLHQDLIRAKFYLAKKNDGDDVLALKAEIRDHYQRRSYTQGQLDGGTLGGNLLMRNSPEKTIDAHEEFLASKKTGHDTFKDHFYVTFRDDHGNRCGFAIDYLRDDDARNTDGSVIASEHRPRAYVITVIRHTATGSRAHCFVHEGLSSLIAQPVEEGVVARPSQQMMETDDIMQAVNPLLNSSEMSKLLDGVVVNNQLSLEKFYAVKETLKKKHNYHSCYEELIAFEQKLAGKPAHLREKGRELADVFRTIIANEQDTDGLDELFSASISTCTQILDHLAPGDKHYQEHLQGLVTVSEKLSQRANPLWKRLAAALLGFAGAALVVLGVIATIPTAGASIAAIIGGVASMGGAAALLASGDAKDQKLSSSVAFFKAAVEKERKTPTPAAAEDHVAANPLLAATTGVKP